MIYTVCGGIQPFEMGITLGHEHFKWEEDLTKALNRYTTRISDDYEDLQSYQIIMPVLNHLKSHGCKCIVEASPPFGGENLKLLYRLSQATDVHIIANTGLNFDKSTFNPKDEKFIQRLAEQWICDFTKGMDTIDDQLIRPGYIKLLLDRGKLSEVDKAMLLAAAIACKETGMPIHCHILEANMVYKVAALLDDVGFDYSKFLWAHTDRESDLDVIAYAIQKGMWLGLDQIRVGTEKEKHALLKAMLQKGARDKIIMSQDYDFYEEAVADSNNHPCAYLFETFIPYCIEQGMDSEQLNQLLKDNPSKFYNID